MQHVWHWGDVDIAQLNQIGAGTMVGHIGIEFLDRGENWLKARMPVDNRTIQPFGRLHGGASVALAETVASVAGMLSLDPDAWTAVGMEINANHLRPVAEGFVTAIATPEALQRNTQIWSVRITDETSRLICISRVTLAVIPVSRSAPS